MYDFDFEPETLDKVVYAVTDNADFYMVSDDLEGGGRSVLSGICKSILEATLGVAFLGTADAVHDNFLRDVMNEKPDTWGKNFEFTVDDTVYDDFFRDVVNEKPDTWGELFDCTIDFAKNPETVSKVFESIEPDPLKGAKERKDMAEEIIDNLKGLQNDPDGNLATNIGKFAITEAVNRINDINNIKIKKELERELPNEEYRKLMKIGEKKQKRLPEASPPKKKWWHFWKK